MLLTEKGWICFCRVFCFKSKHRIREQIILCSNLKPNTLFSRLNRMTSMEREEKEKVKKREKKLEDEETLQQATWVKYTFPIKHQVYHTLS